MTSPTLDSVDGSPERRFGGIASVLLVHVIVAVGVFEALWFGLVTDTGLSAADPTVVSWVVDHRTAGLLAAARLVSDIGGPAVTITGAAMAVVWWAWRGRWRAAGWGAAGVGALIVLDVGMKALIARPRPPAAWQAVAVQGSSFPSGHALLSVGLVLLMGWVAYRCGRLPSGAAARVTIGGLTAGALVAVGASRVVLAVHFPSDVLAGWALAVLAVAALAFVDVAWTRQATS